MVFTTSTTSTNGEHGKTGEVELEFDLIRQ